VGGCLALLETGLRREASSLLPPSCAPLSTSWRQTPANAVRGPTHRDASQGAHENLFEVSSKMSFPRNTSKSNYITLIQQCMSKAQTNKPITAEVLLELYRQSAVTPTYQCGLGGRPQHSPQRPSPHNGCSSAATGGHDQREVPRQNTQARKRTPKSPVALLVKSTCDESAKITTDVKQTSR